MSRGQPHVLPPDPATYRTVLGHFATGVTVITAIDGEEPVGMACNSFTSVSLEPPLVLFCAAESSSTWPRIQRAGKWAANFLDDDGEEVCRVFAQRGIERFAHISYSIGRTGSPILRDSLAFVDCETIDEYTAGDHTIVVGKVLELGYQSEGKPLIFYRGGYGRFVS